MENTYVIKLALYLLSKIARHVLSKYCHTRCKPHYSVTISTLHTTFNFNSLTSVYFLLFKEKQLLLTVIITVSKNI